MRQARLDTIQEIEDLNHEKDIQKHDEAEAKKNQEIEQVGTICDGETVQDEDRAQGECLGGLHRRDGDGRLGGRVECYILEN